MDSLPAATAVAQTGNPAFPSGCPHDDVGMVVKLCRSSTGGRRGPAWDQVPGPGVPPHHLGARVPRSVRTSSACGNVGSAHCEQPGSQEASGGSTGARTCRVSTRRLAAAYRARGHPETAATTLAGAAGFAAGTVRRGALRRPAARYTQMTEGDRAEQRNRALLQSLVKHHPLSRGASGLGGWPRRCS